MENFLMFLRCKREKLQKLWLMSKWTFLFVFLGIINTHGTVYSQNEQQVTISMKNAYLKDILWAIQRQTTFVFMYHEEDLDKVGKVNVEAKASTVEKILSDCLKGTGLTYVFQNEVIVLKPLDDEKKKEIRIAGKVTDEEKAPLPGVTIMVKGTNLGTATNAEGRYSLTLPEMKGITLLFSFVGMEPREVKYTGKDIIDVVMREDKVKMDEVVVTGYMNVRKESFTGNATTVTRDQLMKVNNKNVIAALQAFDPSFRIKENNIWGSDPNALPEFNIRGESSIAVNKGLDVEQQRRNQRTNLKDNPNMPVFILDGFEVSVEKIYDMDLVLYVCNGSFWHLNDIYRNHSILKKMTASLSVICNMCSRQDASAIATLLNCSVYHFPYDSDMFKSSVQKETLIQKLLELKGGASLSDTLKGYLRKSILHHS